jgi:SAM-dependent methyltransferase
MREREHHFGRKDFRKGNAPRAGAPPLRKGGGGGGEVPKATHWGEVAGWYDELVGDSGSEYHREVILPGVLRVLELKEGSGKGLSVLDLACGQGVLCRRLAQMGCRVVGVDAAVELIAAARNRNLEEGLSIRYEVGDATKLVGENGRLLLDLKAAGEEKFEGLDAVTLVLAVQNMTPLSPVWQGCRAALKPGGRLVVVMMHPTFRVPKASDWIWQDKGSGGVGEQGRVVYQYLSSSKVEIEMQPGKAARGHGSVKTSHFHRPLQAYVNTLGNAGLLIDHVEEWVSHKVSQAGPKKGALDRARKEIPMFLAVRARKL